jgi:hypothetical protein
MRTRKRKTEEEKGKEKRAREKGVVFLQHLSPLGVDKIGKTCYTKGLGPRIEYVLAYLFNMNHGASP